MRNLPIHVVMSSEVETLRNAEARMTNDETMTNDGARISGARPIHHSDFSIPSSFVIRHSSLIAAVVLVFAVFATYAPALRNGFVWDDTALILRDPLIRSWRLIPEGFNHFLFVDATASDFYRPIQRLTDTIEYAAFGFWTAPYHFTNIILHAAAALAFFFFAEELLALFDV